MFISLTLILVIDLTNLDNLADEAHKSFLFTESWTNTGEPLAVQHLNNLLYMVSVLSMKFCQKYEVSNPAKMG